MQSKATDVESYLAEVPAERRECLDELRRLCRRTLKGCQEIMAYGMPTYQKDGKVVSAFASQKNYLALYGCGRAIEAHREQLQGLDCGKGCIRFKRPEQLDYAVIKSLLMAAAKLSE